MARLNQVLNRFYFCSYAWPSIGTIHIENVTRKTEIILNIDKAKKLPGIFFSLSLHRISHQTFYSGARPPQDVVDVSQEPTDP